MVFPFAGEAAIGWLADARLAGWEIIGCRVPSATMPRHDDDNHSQLKRQWRALNDPPAYA
jgi:hypothetical protein